MGSREVVNLHEWSLVSTASHLTGCAALQHVSLGSGVPCNMTLSRSFGHASHRPAADQQNRSGSLTFTSCNTRTRQYRHDRVGPHRHVGRPSKPPPAERVAVVHATSRNNDPYIRDNNHAMRRRTAVAARRPQKTARTWPPTPNAPPPAAGHPSRHLCRDRPRDFLLCRVGRVVLQWVL